MKFPRRKLLAFAPFLPVAVTQAEAKKADAPVDVAEAMASALASGAGTLRLPAGEFSVTKLQINKPFVLEGIPGQTVFVGSGQNPLLAINATQDVTISGITLKGSNAPHADEIKSSGLLMAAGVERLHIRDCTFQDSAMSGLHLEKCSGDVSSCHFSKLDEYGLFAKDCQALVVVGNVIDGMGNGGIAVWQSEKKHDGARISNNVISNVRSDSGGTGQYGNGINIYNGANVSITNNLASDCAYSGIRCNSADNAQISGNTLQRARETGLYAEFSFEGSVITGNIVDGGSAGISIANFKEGGRLATCTGNIVRNIRRGTFAEAPPGTGIACEADTLVANNVIESTDAAAIQLGWGEYCRNLSAQGNIIRNTARGISFSDAAGAGHVLIAGNMIDQAREFAIAGMQWDKVTTKDFLVANEKPPAHVMMYGNILIAQT